MVSCQLGHDSLISKFLSCNRNEEQLYQFLRHPKCIIQLSKHFIPSECEKADIMKWIEKFEHFRECCSCRWPFVTNSFLLPLKECSLISTDKVIDETGSSLSIKIPELSRCSFKYVINHAGFWFSFCSFKATRSHTYMFVSFLYFYKWFSV